MIMIKPENNTLITNLGIIAIILVLMWTAVRINHLVFRQIQKKRSGLHLRFFERVITRVILVGGTILAFSMYGGFESIWKTMLGGTAIISAVLAFAAQDIIKDILAGLMISLYKPFEIGNRIELEDGTAGIVTDITMRHVVLKSIDSQFLIIPNSKLNSMSIRNFSYQSGYRSLQFDFHIAYGSSAEQAMEVIRQAIIESEYSLPGKQTENGTDYGPVYFTAYENSSLRLTTTVWYDDKSPTEVVVSDINMRVNRALIENGIEIPFSYINIVQKPQT